MEKRTSSRIPARSSRSNGRADDRPNGRYVGVWVRVSTEEQAEGDSPEHHEKRARYYAESKDWQVATVYRLTAVSGKSVLAHPEAERMLADIRSGRITALIFSKLARLARNTRELLDIADIFQAHGADLVSLQEAIDTSSPAGRLFYTMIAAMAQWEREEIASRVAASVPIRAKLGRPLGGQAPFGYQWVTENGTEKKLVPDPDDAPVRKLVYELFVQIRRIKTVARRLNEMGYRTRSGARFHDSMVERLLRDPSAKGWRRANYTRSTGEGKHWELKPESEWVFSEVEPIVSEALWNEANAILEQRRRTGKRPARIAVHLFGGITWCHCGGKMNVPSNSPKYICKMCRNKIPIVDLEAVFYEQLRLFLLSPEDMQQYVMQADETIKAKEELLAVLEREQTTIAAEMEKTYRLYVDDQITPEGFGRVYKPLEARLAEIQEQIPQTQAEIDFLRIQYVSRDDVLSQAQGLYEHWPELPFEDKRRIVDAITERITVFNEEVVIDLRYHPPLPLPAAPSAEAVTAWHHNFTR